jgi:hypothetical protein
MWRLKCLQMAPMRPPSVSALMVGIGDTPADMRALQRLGAGAALREHLRRWGRYGP